MMNLAESIAVRTQKLVELEQLTAAYPRLGALLERVGPLPELSSQGLPVAEAVTKIVVGQMLSRSAADTIYARMIAARDRQSLNGSWKLGEAVLLKCGVSRRKAKTIQEFGLHYERDPRRFEAWRELSYEDLCNAVSGHWGLSQWSADMLAIFYFGQPDVFPATDGTVIRVRKILESECLNEPLDPALASPFRTSLARYMWAMLDEGWLSS